MKIIFAAKITLCLFCFKHFISVTIFFDSFHLVYIFIVAGWSRLCRRRRRPSAPIRFLVVVVFYDFTFRSWFSAQVEFTQDADWIDRRKISLYMFFFIHIHIVYVALLLQQTSWQIFFFVLMGSACLRWFHFLRCNDRCRNAVATKEGVCIKSAETPIHQVRF